MYVLVICYCASDSYFSKYTGFEWIVTNAMLLNLIQVYRALMDAVVLDWTISLADKDRMKTCVVSYLAQEAKESTTIDPFMPKTRTFLLENLRPNHVSSKLFCLFFFWVTLPVTRDS